MENKKLTKKEKEEVNKLLSELIRFCNKGAVYNDELEGHTEAWEVLDEITEITGIELIYITDSIVAEDTESFYDDYEEEIKKKEKEYNLNWKDNPIKICELIFSDIVDEFINEIENLIDKNESS